MTSGPLPATQRPQGAPTEEHRETGKEHTPPEAPQDAARPAADDVPRAGDAQPISGQDPRETRIHGAEVERVRGNAEQTVPLNAKQAGQGGMQGAEQKNKTPLYVGIAVAVVVVLAILVLI